MKINKEELPKLIVCPICKASLTLNGDKYVCNLNKNHTYPKVKDIPVLIDNASSVFSQEEFIKDQKTFFTQKKLNSLEKLVSHFIPQITLNISYKKNYKDFKEKLLNKSTNPKVLVIGESDLGLGIDELANDEKIQLLITDVSLGNETQVVCDAHLLPFVDGSFDGVVVQAVLEHVLDPYKCVDEIHRILKDGGVVYSSTPFMQQVHGGMYDFTRFSYLGHRRLFRKFKTINDGICCGPGTALAWSYKYFLLSFSQNTHFRNILKLFAHLTSFYLKYFDIFLAKKSQSYDAASAFYFLGEKTNTILSDKELIKLYKGIYDK